MASVQSEARPAQVSLRLGATSVVIVLAWGPMFEVVPQRRSSRGGQRVLLVTSPAPPKGLSPFYTGEKLMPLGLGFLIASLERAGHTVEFTDLYLDPEQAFTVESFDCVGISANTVCLRGTRRLLNECLAARRRGWRGKIVVGGPHTSVAPETLPDEVDHLVQGEGELALLGILSGEIQERLVRAPRIRDLDQLPRPAYERFVGRPYQVTTELLPSKRVFSASSSRGCPFSCSFCSAKNIWTKRYTSFSPERIVDDVRYLVREHKADGIYFREDNFTVSKRRVQNICEGLIAAGINVPWATESRVDTVDEDLLKLMHRAGLRGVYLGIEAATQELLDRYSKGITLEQVERFLGWAEHLGLRVYASFIVDTPFETLADRLAMLRFFERHPRVRCWPNHFTGLPGSELYDLVIQDRAYSHLDDVGLAHLPRQAYPTSTRRLRWRQATRKLGLRGR